MGATKTREHIPFRVRPMLATLVSEAFHRAGWVYEEKYDGERILAYKEGADVRLLSRNAKDYTVRFADIAAAIAGIACSHVAFRRRGGCARPPRGFALLACPPSSHHS